MRYPESRRFRHYKGGLYDVVCIATEHSNWKRDDEPRQVFVIYRGIETGVVWARSVAEWNEPAYVNDREVPRYVLVEPDTVAAPSPAGAR